MLTYTPTPKRPVQPTREYPWLLLLLAFAWLWPGVFSHDLWKPSEPELYTTISETPLGSWLPMLFGEANFQAAPLYVQTAQLCQRLLSPWAADAYSAARFASVFYTSLGLLGSGMAGYRFLGRHYGRSVVLILIGSAGLLPVAHFIDSQSLLFAGIGLAMWGYAVAHRQAILAALLIALASVFLMQSAGILIAAAPLLTGWLLWLTSAQWRSNRILITLVCATLTALPLASIHPVALAVTHPAEFAQYVHQHLFGGYGGTQHFQAAFRLPYYLQHILWFAFPALPLAVWTASRRKTLPANAGSYAGYTLALLTLLIALNPQRNQDSLVLILPPLALLGAAQLDNLRRGAVAFLNWFGAMAFGAAALFLWIGFIAMNYGIPAKLAERAAYFSPYYTRDIDPMPIIVALLFTPMWLIAITRKNIRGRQAVTNWAAGITLVWALLMTLFLPWIDAAKSHRPIVQQMQNSLSDDILVSLHSRTSCLYIPPHQTETRIAWQQYSTLPTTSSTRNCRYMLLQYNPQAQRRPEIHGKTLWTGRRPRSKHEQFVLIDTQP